MENSEVKKIESKKCLKKNYKTNSKLVVEKILKNKKSSSSSLNSSDENNSYLEKKTLIEGKEKQN